MLSNFCLRSMIRAATLSTFCRGWTLAVLTRWTLLQYSSCSQLYSPQSPVGATGEPGAEVAATDRTQPCQGFRPSTQVVSACLSSQFLSRHQDPESEWAASHRHFRPVHIIIAAHRWATSTYHHGLTTHSTYQQQQPTSRFPYRPYVGWYTGMHTGSSLNSAEKSILSYRVSHQPVAVTDATVSLYNHFTAVQRQFTHTTSTSLNTSSFLLVVVPVTTQTHCLGLCSI